MCEIRLGVVSGNVSTNVWETIQYGRLYSAVHD